MKTNKTTLMIASVISALALVAPLAASASPDHSSRYGDRSGVSVQISGGYDRYDGRYGSGGYDNRGDWYNFDARISEMRQRLGRARYYGSLSKHEYYKLNETLNAIAWQKTKFQRSGGIDRHEASVIDERLDNLSAEIHYEKHDGDRGHGYGQNGYRDHSYGHGR